MNKTPYFPKFGAVSLDHKRTIYHMSPLSKAHNITGLLMFLFAATVYILSAEPTTSLWDCGEFISAAYKLEVVHPPGAPLF